MAISPDSNVLPPVSEALSHYAPVAREHGQEDAIVPISCSWIPGQQLVGHCVNRMLDLIDAWSDPAGLFL